MILETYKNLTDVYTDLYFMRQVLAILILFLAGFIPVCILEKKEAGFREMLFSFPLGISVFSVTGFILLISGIRLSLVSIIITYVIVIVLLLIYRQRRIGTLVNINHKSLAAGTAAVSILAVFACSGFLPQNVTNDSVYYYSVYPSILVKDGYLTASLDRFLTDVGQTTALLQCLPFMSGFDETFGIQHFLNMNFILVFFTSLTDITEETGGKKKAAVTAALLCTVFLVTTEPFIVMSTWVLSNVYFSEFLFMTIYLYIRKDLPDPAVFLMTAMLVMSRMEGGVMVCIAALALSALPEDKKRLAVVFGIPMAVMELGYYVNLYLKIGVDPLYSFLDMKTALLMTAMIGGFFIYLFFIRDRIPGKYVSLFLMGLLFAGNIGLLFINHSRYITNFKAFILNIRRGNGWGVFAIMIVIYSLILLCSVVRRRFEEIPEKETVILFMPALLTLTVFAVCFARGGVLAVRTSDSGNRVLMELVPLIVYSVFRVAMVSYGAGAEKEK